MKPALLLLLLAGGAAAGEVTSKAPEAVSATLYQSYRGLPDVALIVETRLIDLPAGDSVLRFDGVAASLIPATAQVSGLTEPPRESDFDFDLFDAATILRKSIGQPVDLVETPPKSPEIHHRGELVAEEGVVLLRNGEGVESFGCGGPAARLEVPVPQGLRAVPSLSVRVHADKAQRREVHLSYLAGNLRWHAAYVARIAADGRHVALTGRIVLDNDTASSFRNVPARFVAGEVNRGRGTQAPIIPVKAVRHDCWALARTTDPVGWDPGLDYLHRMAGLMQQVGISGARNVMAMAITPVSAPAPGAAMQKATLETLGDLKLYRLSQPIQIAAKQQKFFEFAAFPKVEAEPSYTVSYGLNAAVEGGSAQSVWHIRNKEDKGLGRPLPKGAVTLYDQHGGYLGEDSVRDVADREAFDLKGPRLGEVTFDHWLTKEERTGDMTNRSHVLILRNNLGQSAVVDIPSEAGGKQTLVAHETRRLTYETADRF